MPSISKTTREQVAIRAHYCCEYCKTQERLIGMPLVIDHIIPTSMGGENELHNLAAACYRCNQFKGARILAFDPQLNQETTLFHPRDQSWFAHFQWREAGLYISGVTSVGRATVKALRLNNAYVTASRKIWILEDWHPSLLQPDPPAI
ncbi:MAG: HNH endonuclease [Cyanobacteria bacterium P01_A01_bin.116]